MNNTTLIVCLVVAYIAFYYYNKFQESECEYVKLHSEHTNILREMQRVQTRLHDLQAYKDDVSKTFEILDKELVTINDHIKKKDNTDNQGLNLNPSTTSSVSMLTPEVLGMLLENINQEIVLNTPDESQSGELETRPSIEISYTPTGESYQRFLINQENKMDDER